MLFFALGLLAGAGEPAFATQLFAEQTGKNCDYCHIGRPDELKFTPDGELFVKNYYQLPGAAKGEPKSGLRASLERKLRRLLLLLHAAAAVGLTGTIIFFGAVPRRLEREDLGPGERKFIWITLAVSGVCGAALFPSVYVPGKDFWLSTYGGYLGLKAALFALLAVLVALQLGAARTAASLRKGVEELLLMPDFAKFSAFSPSDLKRFNGRKGRRALIAFRGKVLDVTNTRHWENGVHFNKHSAGADLSDGLAKAPHGDAVLFAAKEVGVYDASLAGSGCAGFRQFDGAVNRYRRLARYSASVAVGLAIALAFWRQ